jgi:enoyl-CoA hydratase/carnithine racemase
MPTRPWKSKQRRYCPKLEARSLEPMIGPSTFLYEHDKTTGVVTITLNRPDRLNALTFEIYDELRATFRALDTEPAVRVIVITGAGRAFCSGGDVHDIIGALTARDYRGLLDFTRMTGDLVLAIRRCRRPVVAALNGVTAGAGAVIATAWLLPRIVGFGRATELLMTGDFISAEEALRIGLYNRVVADDVLMPGAREFAERMARGPSFALEITKDALNREATMDLAAAIEAEAQIQASLMTHADFREAYASFLAKRPPRFL